MKTTVRSRDSETNEIALNIDVVYSGLFTVNEDIKDSQSELWVDAQIVPQLLSYTRTVITNLTSQMDIPVIYLPTMDVIESLQVNDSLSQLDEDE